MYWLAIVCNVSACALRRVTVWCYNLSTKCYYSSMRTNRLRNRLLNRLTFIPHRHKVKKWSETVANCFSFCMTSMTTHTRCHDGSTIVSRASQMAQWNLLHSICGQLRKQLYFIYIIHIEMSYRNPYRMLHTRAKLLLCVWRVDEWTVFARRMNTKNGHCCRIVDVDLQGYCCHWLWWSDVIAGYIIVKFQFNVA